MRTVGVSRRLLRRYRGIIRDDLMQELLELGGALRGLRVIHVNATPVGGGVAELLQSVVPLQRDLGLDARWLVLEPDEAFFNVTKHLHNLLQGAPGTLSEDERRLYLAHNQRTAAELCRFQADVWVIHDPQPAAAGVHAPGSARIWRCHIDTSHPNPEAAAFLRPFVDRYDALVYSQPEFRLPGAAVQRVAIIEPAIDPLLLKNRRLAPARAREVLRRIGIDPDRPLVAQVARLDPWKDPLGVIDAYRLAKRRVPALQLALLGVMAAKDDPEAAQVYREVRAYAGDDPDIHVYVDASVIGPVEVAAVQSAAAVILQKSLREGFGLSATEAMWKGTPVIVGNTGGLRSQVVDGVTGYCVNTVEECADRMVRLLTDRKLARRLGRAARERVRERYLLPRMIRDELRLYREVLAGGEPAAVPVPEQTAAS